METAAPVLRALRLALSFLLLGAVALGQECPGDCNGDAEVTIDEIVKARRIAGGAPLSECEAADLAGLAHELPAAQQVGLQHELHEARGLVALGALLQEQAHGGAL